MQRHIIEHFRTVDPILHAVIDKIEVFELTKTSDYFSDLCDAITSQQLSTKVAKVIWERLVALMPDGKVTPENITRLSVEEIRAIGTSNMKAKFIKDLAEKVLSGEVVLENLAEKENDKILEMLTKVKGIGPWTVEMFLIFSLAREDVFSVGDLGLKRAIQKLYKLEEEPTKEQLVELSQKWSPYRTYASRILWKSLDLPNEEK